MVTRQIVLSLCEATNNKWRPKYFDLFRVHCNRYLRCLCHVQCSFWVTENNSWTLIFFWMNISGWCTAIVNYFSSCHRYFYLPSFIIQWKWSFFGALCVPRALTLFIHLLCTFHVLFTVFPHSRVLMWLLEHIRGVREQSWKSDWFRLDFISLKSRCHNLYFMMVNQQFMVSYLLMWIITLIHSFWSVWMVGWLDGRLFSWRVYMKYVLSNAIRRCSFFSLRHHWTISNSTCVTFQNRDSDFSVLLWMKRLFVMCVTLIEM